MMKIRMLLLAASVAFLALAIAHKASERAMAQEADKSGDKNADLQRVLWDADQQWLCSTGAGPHHKPFKDCVEFRRKYWADQFFEISDRGQVRTKAEMIASQSATNYAPVEPYPSDFKLMAVYGNFALATDHTVLKMVDSSGKLLSTEQTRVLRMFVKENGTWRPAGAALVPIASH
jgi:hypothetical protein